MIKNLPAKTGDSKDMGLIPQSEDPLEEEMAIHSSILAWKSPMGRGAWSAIVQEVKKTQLSTYTHYGLVSPWFH